MVDGAASHVWLHEDRMFFEYGRWAVHVWTNLMIKIQAQSLFLGKVLGFSNGSWSFLIIIPDFFVDDGLHGLFFCFWDVLKLSIPTVSKCHRIPLGAVVRMFSMGEKV